jgi:hypothetical protein
MTIIDSGMLWRQFGAAIDMVENALRNCPDELWQKRLWEDQPTNGWQKVSQPSGIWGITRCTGWTCT